MTPGASCGGWGAPCGVRYWKGTRMGLSGWGSLSSGGQLASSSAPEDTWKEWETASQVRGRPVQRQGVDRMALGRV